MKRLAALFLVLISVTVGCAAVPAIVKTTLDITQYACVIAKSDLPDSTAIATACGLDQSLAPLIEMLVAEHQLAARKEAEKMMREQKPGACRGDAPKSCKTSSDCPSDEVCCMPLGAPGGTCRKASECY